MNHDFHIDALRYKEAKNKGYKRKKERNLEIPLSVINQTLLIVQVARMSLKLNTITTKGT